MIRCARPIPSCRSPRAGPAAFDQTIPAAVLALTLFAPALDPADDAARGRILAQPPLRRWLGRARRSASAVAERHAALAAWFGLDGDERDIPHAALALLGSDGAPQDGFWLHADPVHLHARGTELVLVDAAHLQVDAAESAALIGALQAHFAQDGLLLQAGAPTRWFLRANAPAALRTVALETAVGRSVDALLPRGADALTWLRRTNEAQMLLHAHPVNVAREARGAPALNSLWLWGAGMLPQCRSGFAGVWGGDDFVRGMARSAGNPVHALPADAGTLLAAAGSGEHLVVLDPPARDDADALEALAARWAEPLLRALASARLARAVLATYTGGRRMSWSITRGDSWKFWRRDPFGSTPSGHERA